MALPSKKYRMTIPEARFLATLSRGIDTV